MTNQQLITDGLALLPQLSARNQTAVSAATLLQRYDAGNSKLHAYLMASRPTDTTSGHSNLLQLYRKMEPAFDESELHGLCFDMSIDYDDLKGENRPDKLRALITYVNRRQELPKLVSRCRLLRPHQNWDLEKLVQTETGIQSKLNLAAVIDIARPTLQNVAAYLDDKEMAVNFVVFRHQQPGQFFDVNDDWQALVITFGDVMDRVKREFNGAKIHFFMAGPSSLLFAMACVWGTVDEALVYHYENDTYHPVIPITRNLRQVLSGWS